ncbi:MAG: DinB family protein [Candidatus Eisenbacteria bacterium]|nr:DinB family protein [Candidatus Eisenbacteria bacterium]
MIDKAPWIGRGFAFDLPLSMFPNLIERLRGTPARVEERVRGVSPRFMVERVDCRWSIQENIGHLVEVENLWHGRLDDYASAAAELRPADMENRRTQAGDYNRADLGQILARFRRERSRLIDRLEGLSEAEVLRTAHHPRLDRPMRVLDMMVFGAEHDDHHLARISELLRRRPAEAAS